MSESDLGSVESHLPLHPLEFQILLTLTDGVAHAYRIVQLIESRQPGWSQILPTNLYRRIWRLASQGLVVEVAPTGESHQEKRRKYFSITPLGRAVATAEATRLRELLTVAEEAGIRPTSSSGVTG